ncbi:uncharacterized protein [Nicotiana sylvestris]|uniref:uncharacterized protein n=1 Tax=Nicotiana sylvestris TaxID=4096 RepID=UPI00388C5713
MNMFVHNLKVGLFGFLETRIKRAKGLNASFYLCQGWSFVTNLDKYPGGRIWLLWKPHLYDVDIRVVTKQMIHCKVKHKRSRMRFNMTMVYGFNEQAARRKLWEDINQIGAKMDEPWAVMGDFNCILNREERIGSRVTMAETRDFRQCIEACGLKDLRSSGAFIMWNNKQGGDSRVYNRIDKVLVNTEWIIELPPPEVHFMHEEFQIKVQEVWKKEIHGTKMYQLIGKLNRTKSVLLKLNKEKFSNVERRAEAAMEQLTECQRKIQNDPRNVELIEEEVLCNRLKGVLPTIISENQSAFVEGSHDLGFVEEMLYALNFPVKFIKWTMKCMTTTQYSIALNGGLYGCIERKRGLRHGDTISPLIFVICMEYFTRLMQWVATQEGFAFHTKCKGLKLNHPCFADDVLIFCKGEYQSIMLMLRGLQTFSNTSGLSTNDRKSNVYSANMDRQCLENICEITGYKKGTMPFMYLGVPIVSRKLKAIDCEILVEKLSTRIHSWGSKNLSYAGRVQLINSVDQYSFILGNNFHTPQEGPQRHYSHLQELLVG